MKMTQKKWAALPLEEKRINLDLGELTPQLIGLEGWRVEVTTSYDEKYRFIVGRSTGWQPIHLEVANRRSSGGPAASKSYLTVTKLYDTRK